MDYEKSVKLGEQAVLSVNQSADSKSLAQSAGQANNTDYM